MEDHVSGSIQKVKDLRIHGRYADATHCLQQLVQDETPDMRLVVELSDTLFVQGHFNQAIETLDRQTAQIDLLNDSIAVASIIIRGLSHFFATGQFLEKLHHVETAYDHFATSQQSKIINDITVKIETYYCKFRHLAASCRSYNNLSIESNLLPKLQKAFNLLEERDDFYNALSVARTYNTCCNNPEKTSLVKRIAESDQAPRIYRAHAQLLLAEAINSNDLKKEQDRLFALARESFQLENHFHGVLDVEIGTACRLPLDPEDDAFGFRLRNSIKQYEDLNYPTGYGDALLKLLSLFQGLNDFKTESLILDELENLFHSSTSRLPWFYLRISKLAKWAARGGDRGKVIQEGQVLWTELSNSDCTFLRGQVAQIVSQAYNALKDLDLVTLWSQRAQKDIPGTNLTAVPALLAGYDLGSTESLAQCYQFICSLADPNSTDYSPSIAMDRLEIFLDQSFIHHNRDALSLNIIDAAIELYEKIFSEHMDIEYTPKRLAKLREAQATLLMLRASSRQDIDLEVAALEPLKEARKLLVQAKELGNAIIVLQREALLHVGIAQKSEGIQSPQAKSAWENALKQYSMAFDSAKGLGIVFLAADNAYWVALCQYRLWARGWCLPTTVLESLLVAEGFVDRRRQEVSILGGIAAAVTKGRLSSDEHPRNMYRFAYQICVSVGNIAEAWNWIQKSKARSLSDLLGLGVFVPLELTERIRQDTMCQQLFEEEYRLAKALQDAPDIERFKGATKLEEHQSKMREHEVLAELLDLREGVPVTLDDLPTDESNTSIRSEHKSATVFIDWIANEAGVSICVVKQGKSPSIRNLPITTQVIQQWILEHLDAKSDASENQLLGMQEDDEVDEGPLRELDVLVRPLADLSRPGDLLVLCPTGTLHALPLHALRVDSVEGRQTLIERNPVVYCASLTSFVQCCRHASSNTQGDIDKRFLAIYEPETEPESDRRRQFSENERNRIYASNERLSVKLKGQSLCGEAVSGQSFKESLECADWVQFFGHYDYGSDHIAEQSLRLFDQKQGKGEEIQSAQIAVKDLFDLHLKASHVSLLACSSAVQRFQAGDEPLGLIPALLCTGATSVIGTLWPVQSPAARLFSEKFYDFLLESEQDGCGIYNLAWAVREAILEVKQLWQFRQPYYWASFVLHGAWFFKGNLSSR